MTSFPRYLAICFCTTNLASSYSIITTSNQDVGDLLTAIDSIIEMKLADPSKIVIVGGSHGGFLTTHFIGQAPDKFAVAAARNPVCNLALMSGTTDIPEWCFVETYGTEGKANFTDAPSKEQLNDLYDKSPIAPC